MTLGGMTNRLRPAAAAATLLVAAACGGGGGGVDLATTGPAEFPVGDGDDVALINTSDPLDERRTLLAVVANPTGDAKADVVLAGIAFDSAGAEVAQARSQVIAPLTVPKEGLGLAQITFSNPLPDPFTVEWEIRKGEREKDRVDLQVTSLDIDANGNAAVNVENSTGGRAKVVHVVVMCLDQAGKPFAVTTLPGPDARMAKGASARIEGAVAPGCVSAVAGAIGTKNVT